MPKMLSGVGKKIPLHFGHTYAPCLLTFISAPHFGQTLVGTISPPAYSAIDAQVTPILGCLLNTCPVSRMQDC
jgi:hypothetical protein